MLTLEEIKALEFCTGNVTTLGVGQARMLVLAADALKRERAELDGRKTARVEAERTETEKKAREKTIAEIFERLRREKEKEKTPYDHPRTPPAPTPICPDRPWVGDPIPCGRSGSTASWPDFPRTG